MKYIILMILLSSCTEAALVLDPPETNEDMIAVFEDMTPEEQRSVCVASTLYCPSLLSGHNARYELLTATSGTARVVYIDSAGDSFERVVSVPTSIELENIMPGSKLRIDVLSVSSDVSMLALSIIVDGTTTSMSRLSGANIGGTVYTMVKY